MENYQPDQLLMCDKSDLVKYIQELRESMYDALARSGEQAEEIEKQTEEIEQLQSSMYEHQDQIEYWKCWCCYADPKCDAQPNKYFIDDWCKENESLKIKLYHDFYIEDDEDESDKE